MTSPNQEPHLEKILEIPHVDTDDVTTEMGVYVGYEITELGMQEEYLDKSAAAREDLQDVTPFLNEQGSITRAEKIHIIEKHTVGDLAVKYRDYLIDNAFYSSNYTRRPDGKLIYSIYIYDKGKRLSEWLKLVDKLTELAKPVPSGCVIWEPPKMPHLFETRLMNLLKMFFDSIVENEDGSLKLHLKEHKPIVIFGGQALTGIIGKSKKII